MQRVFHKGFYAGMMECAENLVEIVENDTKQQKGGQALFCFGCMDERAAVGGQGAEQKNAQRHDLPEKRQGALRGYVFA